MKKFCLIICFFVSGYGGYAQQILSLSECRNQARLHNPGIQITEEAVNMAKQLQKAAFTRYFPGLNANGVYAWNEKNISLLGHDQYLPVGTKMADGSFGFTQEQVNNGWTLINGQAVPLDAGGLPFDPKLNPEKILWKNYAIIPADAFEMDAKTIFTGAISLTQPVFMGGKIRELNRIAACSAEIARLQNTGAVTETLYKVDEAYWRLVSLEQKKRLADSYVELLERLDHDMQKSIATGMATKSDGLSVKVKLNEAAMMQLQVYDGLVLSRMYLCSIIGMPLSTDIRPADVDAGTVEAALPAMDSPASAADRRYEIGILSQLDKISHSNLRIARSRFMPNLVLNSGYLVSNPNIYNGYQKTTAGMWQAGLVLNVPLFQWGERIHTLNAAASEQKIANLRITEAREKIELEVSQAQFKVTEAEKKLHLTKTNRLRAEENLKMARLGFDAGMVSTVVLMEAQNAWLKAQTDEIDAGIEYRQSVVYLSKSTGNLQ